MKHEHREHLTKSIIERDIKTLYSWYIKGLIPGVLFSYLGILVLWFSCDLNQKSSHNWIIDLILTLYIIILLGATVYLIYFIIQYFKKNTKYTIVSDTFTKFGIKHELGYEIFGMHCLCFSKHGKYLLHPRRIYYSWSNLHCMNNDGIMNRSIPGDKFYLVIKNKRILNVYNQKIFILDDK